MSRIPPSAGLRVMTYNVGNGLAPASRLAEVIRASLADVVGLQEVTADQEAGLRRLLGDDYPYQILHGDGIPGKGLLSRHPIVEGERLHSHPARPDLRATIDAAGRTFQVAVVHPEPPRLHARGLRSRPHTAAQFDRLVSLAAHELPLVLLGDFNMTRLQAQYRRVTAAGLVDAFFVAGRGFGQTFPLRRGRMPLLPVLRLDYIWLSSQLEPLSAHVGRDAGSDHLPVIADLRWRPC
ncbi:MAG: endonuclease/exonuclease/phosphatase family protein [Dehalococcoidia bacterium]